MSQVNRRSFIRFTGAGVAAVALDPEVKAAPAKRPRTREDVRAEMPVPTLNSKDVVCQGKPFSGFVRDGGGRPMAGVVVTNGRDSVKTNEKGEYTLPEFPEARFISVTVPSGYETTWHYVDAWARLGGFNFSLRRSRFTGGKGCSFVHISDSEIKAPEYGGFWTDVRDLAARHNCAFAVHTGDICGRQGILAHAQIMNSLSMGRPMVYVMGNHDAVSAWPWGEAEFEAVYGPSWYSFEAGGVHFVVTPMCPDNCDRVVSYDEDQIADWLRGDLALVDPKMPVVLLNHFIPNAGRREKAGFVYGVKRPLDLRKVCNYRGIVFGHTHNTWFRRSDGVAFVNTSPPQVSGIDHSPNCARVITVTETGEITSKTFFGDLKEMTSERAGAVWERTLLSPATRGGLVDGGEVLYVATGDDDGLGTGRILAVAKTDGAVRWETKVDNSIKGALAIAGGKVFGTDVEGVVYALDAKSGAVCWKVRIDGDDLPGRRQMISVGTAASPDGKRIVAGVGRCQSVLDAASGAIVWRDTRCQDGEPSSVTPVWANGCIATPHNWRPSVCVDAETGKVLWTAPHVRFPGASAIIDGETVIMTSEGTLYELDLKTGKEIRSRKYPFGLSSPGDFALTDRLYLKGVNMKGLVAIDRRTLDVVWQADVGKGLIGQSAYAGKGRATLATTPAVIDGGRVAAACGDGTVCIWNLADGKKLREIRTGAPYVTGVIASGGKVFAADLSGKLRAFAV